MNALLQKKIISYTGLAAATLLTNQYANGQILYHDVVPDDTIGLNDNLSSYDLNDDGLIDLNIYNSNNGSTNVWYFEGHYGYQSLGAICSPPPIGKKFTKALESNYYVGAGNSLWNYFGLGNGYLMVNSVPDGFIGSLQPGDVDKFIGVAIPAQTGNWNYGWMRMDVAADASYVIIKDYAINLQDDAGILTGEGTLLVCNSGEQEPNNSLATATSLAENTSVHSTIGFAGDKDIYKVVVTAAAPNVSVTLKDLPKNYDLAVAKPSGNIIQRSKNLNNADEEINYNNVSPGTYYLLVYQKNNHFTADACYTLSFETSIIPFKLLAEGSVNTSPGLTIYPNPVTTGTTIDFSMNEYGQVEISLIDLQGKKVKTITQVSLEAGNHSLDFDAEGLTQGIYFVQLKTKTSTDIRKIVVQ